jgi:radical SAM protein with 4Fe4S-binding SPASM domain
MIQSPTCSDQIRSEPLPKVLQVEPTVRCNLSCVFCKTKLPFVQQRGEMPLETFHRLIDQVAQCCTRLNLWGTGEPMLHPRIMEMARYASQHGFKRVKISTNGHYLSDEQVEGLLTSGFTCVRVSLEDVPADKYADIRRGGDYQRVLDGLGRLCASRKRLKANVRIVVVSVASEENPARTSLLNDYLEKIGVDEHMYQFDVWRVGGANARVLPKERCAQLYGVLNVLADGTVVPCCHLHEGEIILGSIHDQHPLVIWQSAQMERLRATFEQNKMSQCHTCNYSGPLEFRQTELPILNAFKVTYNFQSQKAKGWGNALATLAPPAF